MVTLENLPKLKIAATFFSPLEKVLPGKLDFMRYGIVARGTGFEPKMGGALPNSQIYTSEIEQYTHARWRNAKIGRPSRTTCSATRLPNASSPANTGCPTAAITIPRRIGPTRRAVGKALTERARSALQAAVTKTPLGGAPLPDGLIPAPVFAVAVTLYHRGVAGCFLTWNGSLDACVVRAATRALSRRPLCPKGTRAKASQELRSRSRCCTTVSGSARTTLGKAAVKLRMGADTMSVQQGDRRGFLLASVGPHFNWGKERFVRGIAAKGGHRQAALHLVHLPDRDLAAKRRRACARSRRVFPNAASSRRAPSSGKPDMALLGGYIARNIGANGLPEYAYLPVTGQRAVQGSPARLIHALAVLDEAGQALGRPDWRATAARGLGYCMRRLGEHERQAHAQPAGQAPYAMADSQLLFAASRHRDA